MLRLGRRRGVPATVLTLVLTLLPAVAVPLRAQTGTTAGEVPLGLEGVAFDQRLGDSLPAGLTFLNEKGATVRLGDLLGKKPLVLALVYFECPMLCSLELQGLLRAIRALPLNLGDDYDIVTVSFDPGETTEMAAKAKREYVRKYNREGSEAGWHFLTGDEENIRRLTQAVGFRYRYQPESDQYAHASGVIVVTPEGVLSRYFYGVEFSTRDLRLALVEASAGRVGSLIDQVLLFCFHYDPAQGRYSLAILNIIRLLGVATVLALVGFMWIMLRRERLRRSAPPQEGWEV
jgi:protein SCO1/2